MTGTQTRRAKKPAMTHITFLIDESGSMAPTAADVRGGFNAYVDHLAGDGNTYRLSIIKFGSHVRPLCANLPLAEVPRLTEENYRPLDTTALYDAIGYGLAEAQRLRGTTRKPYGRERELFIIMTDGFENSSREYTRNAIVTGIKQREEAGNWTFVYLGADQDAWAIGQDLGLAKGNVLSYHSAESGTMFRSLATASSATAGSALPHTVNFFNP